MDELSRRMSSAGLRPAKRAMAMADTHSGRVCSVIVSRARACIKVRMPRGGSGGRDLSTAWAGFVSAWCALIAQLK